MMIETVLSRAVRTSFAGGVALGLGLFAYSVQAQDAKPEEKAQRVVITGTAIPRTQTEQLPVTVIKREDIDRTGATTAQDLVAMIPSNFGGTVVASNVGVTGNASTANLRQLGPKYTLVLLNGRRVANYAFGNSPVDLNSIPISAIERVEVLRDGASSLYGADAIAGVINFILRKDFRGMEASVYATNVSQSGGGNTRSINFSGGWGDLNTDKFNFFLSANREENEKLRARDRSFANTAKRDDLGINNSSARNGIPNLTFKDTLGNQYTSINPYRHKNCDFPEMALVVRNATECGTDYVKYIDIVPAVDHDNLVGRLVHRLSENHELYAEGAITRDYLISAYSPAPFTNPFAGYPQSGRFYPSKVTLPKGMTLKAGHKMPDGTVLASDTVLNADMDVTPSGAIAGRWRTVPGGGRHDETVTVNQRWLLGAKGEFAGWDYDTGLTFSRNEGTVSFGPGQYSYAKLTPLLESGEINIFGAQDAKSMAALESARLYGDQRKAVSESKEFDLRISRELAKLSNGGSVALATGVSYRREDLEQISLPVLASGDPVGGDGPVPGVTGSRNVLGLFGELSWQVYKDLEIQAAARYDRLNNNFGVSFSKVSPKLSLRFTPSKEIMVRASYGQGYRAPTLYENLRPFTSGGATGGSFSDPLRCPNGRPISNTSTPVGVIQDECEIQLTTATVGDMNLQPEKSKQYTLGFVFQPTSTLSGSLDFWKVDISDAIIQKSEIQVMSDPVANQKYFYRYDPNYTAADGSKPFKNGWVDDGKQTGAMSGSTNVNFPLAYVFLPYENTASIFASGIDINLNYKHKTASMGNWSVNLDGTYYTRHGYQYPGLASVSDNGAYKDFGSVPRWRHGLTMAWDMKPWSASITHNYTSSYKDFTDPASIGADYPAERTVGAYSTFDTQVSWNGVKNLDITFGIRNIFDQDPPSSRKSAGFQVGYDEKNVNPLGRTYYLRARYKF
ncbi:TonB-dependent receptor [Massilia sp. W12]|uniref:TonB-dependent receptor plug domain-containing protein n=1 Tax=Massilia sp. W12 TaxID=3126507 RepID=UPI0030CF55F9